MARPLVVVAGAGIAISIISLWLASLLGPGDGLWLSPPWGYEQGSRGRAPFTDSGEVVSRPFSWSGGDTLEVDIPGRVYYERAAEWSVVATGRQSSVERLLVGAGRISLDGTYAHPSRSSLEVHIKGPALRRIGLNGSGSMVLEGVDQEDLAVSIRGSGSIRGRGTVQRLEVRILGSGDADLADLASGDLDASILGSGDAEVSATGDAEVSIIGSGDVRLRAKPRNLSTRVIGSGRVVQPPAE